MQPQDRTFYEDSLKDYRDLKSAIDTSFKEGMEKGMQKGMEREKLKLAKSALNKGLPIALIQELTGLNEQEIESLRKPKL
jgi:predicted transposase/invertase (TIGR01784 family)